MQRNILTLLGNITINRYVLRPIDALSSKKLIEITNKNTLIPLDNYLKIDCLDYKITVNLMLKIAYYGTKLRSFSDVESYFLKTYNIIISDTLIREITLYIGKIIFDNDRKESEAIKEKFYNNLLKKSYEKDYILYIMMDGAFFETKETNENGSTWRENKLAIIFSSADIKYWKNKKGLLSHKILRKEYVSYVGKSDEFKFFVLSAAYRNGYENVKKTVLINDGAIWIKNIKDELFQNDQQILDLYHLKEKVHDSSKQIFNNNSEECLPWAHRICSLLEDGKWKEVLKIIEKYKDIFEMNGNINLHDYIYNNRDIINYPEYKKMGYFVGSGAIESAHRVVLQNRLKLPGMRWNVVSAQNMLSLKAKLESGLWDEEVCNVVTNVINNQHK